MTTNPDDDLAIENFRTYLRMPSIQPDPDCSGCVTFLNKLAEDIGLSCVVYEFVPKRPIVRITLPGTQPSLGSIILNSHMDVVCVSREDWHHDPFGAEMDESGNIYARGAQDTKCLGIQYLEAIRRLIKNGQKFLRTVHILFVPDEESGGTDGMGIFVERDEFRALNAEFALDEGDANPGPVYNIYNGEKSIWHVAFHVRGTEGHGSLDLRNTCGEKLRRLLDSVMEYRQTQLDKIDSDPSITVSDVTFINFTQVEGGSEVNVVPSVMSAKFDIRLAATEDHDKMTQLLQGWAAKAGSDTEIEYLMKEPPSPLTPVDETNPFWTAMYKTFEALEQKIQTKIFAGGADGVYLRQKGVRTLLFSPIDNTPKLAHANDEYLNKDVFLKGIQVFMKLIPAIANVESLS